VRTRECLLSRGASLLLLSLCSGYLWPPGFKCSQSLSTTVLSSVSRFSWKVALASCSLQSAHKFEHNLEQAFLKRGKRTTYSPASQMLPEVTSCAWTCTRSSARANAWRTSWRPRDFSRIYRATRRRVMLNRAPIFFRV